MPRLTSGFSTAAETDIRTGAGNNQVQYNINAPVSIDGGTGFDKVVVLGTEFADHIVITDKGDLRRRPHRHLRQHRGARGRRRSKATTTSTCSSTPAGVVTRVIGGLGSDTINVAGDVTGDVVSHDIEGSSGTINHLVRSADARYNGMVGAGIDLSVARGQPGVRSSSRRAMASPPWRNRRAEASARPTATSVWLAQCTDGEGLCDRLGCRCRRKRRPTAARAGWRSAAPTSGR